jgi:hypothetical protein
MDMPVINTTFSGTRKTERIIGRRDELNIIYKSIYEPEADCIVILLEGDGGMGKSRLLEEVIWRIGNPGMRAIRLMEEDASKEFDWSKAGDAIVSNVIDLRDISLHSRNPFLQAICAALGDYISVDFSHFDEAYDRFQTVTDQQSDFRMVNQAAQEALDAFLQDYRRNSEQQRLVLCLDTVEELAVSSSEWLLQQGLLRIKIC